MGKGYKSIETKYYEERAAFFDELGKLDRRAFLRVAACPPASPRAWGW